MNKNDQQEASRYKVGIASGKLETLNLVVPKGVGDRFRQIAKKSKMTTTALFEEMVDAYAHGSGLD